MKNLTFSFITALFFTSIYAQEYETAESGITVEIFKASNTDESKYNRDNIVYTEEKVFTYNYSHKKQGVNYLMASDTIVKTDAQGWKLEPLDNHNPKEVTQIILTVQQGNPFAQTIPDYSQTVIQYEMKMANGELWPMSSQTGVIENEHNTWVHPPRTEFFQILALNPFPYIKFPAEINNKWEWEMEISDDWGNPSWMEWKGIIKNKYTYEIIGKTKLSTPLGSLDCYVIKSEAESRLGRTGLTAYYNETHGFVKLDYTNIDGSKTIITLESVN